MSWEKMCLPAVRECGNETMMDKQKIKQKYTNARVGPPTLFNKGNNIASAGNNICTVIIIKTLS